MFHNNKKGFTIVELVIVIAVVAVLAAVLIPTFANLIEETNKTVDQQFVDQINELVIMSAAADGKEVKNVDLAQVLAYIEENGIKNYASRYENYDFYWDDAEKMVYVWDSKENKVAYPEHYKHYAATTRPQSALLARSEDKIVEGGDIVIVEDVVRTEDTPFIITEDAAVNFGDKVIKLEMEGAPANYNALRINGGEVTLDGKDGGLVTSDNIELYALTVGVTAGNSESVKVTISGGKYIGGTTAVNVVTGTVTITGGFFQVQSDDLRYVINCNDTQWKEGDAKLIVTGGTFVNFNPADGHETLFDADGNVVKSASGEIIRVGYVAEGYTVEQAEQENGDIWYTVVPVETPAA